MQRRVAFTPVLTTVMLALTGCGSGDDTKNKLVCTQTASGLYTVTIIESGVSLTRGLFADLCEEMRSHARRGLVCAPDESGMAVMRRVSDGQPVGERMFAADCIESLAK